MEGLKSVLRHVPAYVLLQRIVGADRLRYRCIEEIRPGETVLDVGCGPAYYFPRLPQPVKYHGFDTDAPYIDWAKQRFGGENASFHCGIFDEAAARALPPIDVVLLLGLLHHMSDEQCTDLLNLAASVLSPGGRVISLDTCFEPTQGRISRWMSENDRGEYVREPAAFEKLALQSFGQVEGKVVNDATHIPASYWMMTMTAPTGSWAE
ncbi:SAM-dependent methyltransferase [Kribbella orskensis]|uniref:SAM-dependent methyltransferase n=1 Tax=Kribbella orskensis TaxID=2512216 RepID=A0ABY2B8K8_9ACTN|nr:MULTISPECIES: class I SAM-dependent methyltransferase [Kribbella]TCN31081.1 SAM-dependent methyltransferase [Kribbella sp. VKM Ac-2500]TCO11616.1 SAM-dependent methyltransferase [Kribbella orskensis]